MKRRVRYFALRQAPALLFVAVAATLSILSPKFFSLSNALNLVVQSAPIAVVAVGMTFVLLTAGVDLSVGAIMFAGAALATKLLLAGHSVGLALLVMIGCGVLLGAVNGFLIVRARLAPFIVTLAMLFVWRGFALWVTETRAMNLPDWFLQFGTARLVGVPVPVVVFASVFFFAQITLTRTPFGRQLYAIGNNLENARKAGLPLNWLLFAVYAISGLCAAIGGILALTQLGAVSPKFGETYEFKAIAAAVLGGTSLFGGRGAVWPGTLLGVLLIQMLESGLVMLNADPYLYPIVTASVILFAVLLDATRQRVLARHNRRQVYHIAGSS